MIQASHGAGLSGITANAAKDGKGGGKGSAGGLFAKLLAILEKHSLNAAKIGVSATTNSGLGGRFSSNDGKGQNVNLATGLKNTGTDSDTAIIATALQINAGLLTGSKASAQSARQEIISGPEAQSKHLLSVNASANAPAGHAPGDIETATTTGEKSLLSPGRNPSARSGAPLNGQTETMTIASNPVIASSDKPGPSELNKASAQSARQEIISGPDTQSKNLLSVNASANAPTGHGSDNIETATTTGEKSVLSSGRNPSARSGAALASQTETMTIASNPVLTSSDKPGPGELNKASLNIQTNQTPLTEQRETGVNLDKDANPAHYKTTAHLRAQSGGQKLPEAQPMTSPESVNHLASSEKGIASADQRPSMESQLAKAGLSAGKVKADQSSIAAQASAPLLAAHLIQHQQGGASTAATSVSAASNMAQQSLDANSSDASGQQSSDKGSQDGRTLLTSVDGRSNHSTAATGSSFSSYLSHKSESGMNVFDSMQYIAQSAKDGKTKLEIQLEPAHLGKINISLQTDAAKQLQVHLIVDQNSTRQVLEQQMPALRQALAQQGLDLSGFSFGSQSHGGQFDAQHQSHDGGNNVNHLTNSELPGESHRDQARPTVTQGHPLGGLSIRV